MSHETSLVSWIQMLSILIGAFGAPGLTFWMLRRLNAEIVDRMDHTCNMNRIRFDERITRVEEEVTEIKQRQIQLRETLPKDYVRRDEFVRHLDRNHG